MKLFRLQTLTGQEDGEEEDSDLFDSLDLFDSMSQSLDSTEANLSIESQEKQPKKRKPTIRSEEARERRNQRRRVNLFPRILKRDIRRQYIDYYVNVLNSADIRLMKKYLDRFYHPNVIFAKSEYSEATHNTPKKQLLVYQARGKQVIYDFFATRMENSPDSIIQTNETQLQVDPKTNRSIISTRFRVRGTKIKANKSHYDAMIRRMIDIVQGIDNSSQYQMNNQSNALESQKLYKNLLNSEEEMKKKIVEFDPNTFFQHRLDVLGGNDLECTKELANFLKTYYTVYKETMSCFPPSPPQSTSPDLTADLKDKPKHSEDDPMIFMNPQIKMNLEGILLMYLDENYMISHLETKLISLKLEPIFVE